MKTILFAVIFIFLSIVASAQFVFFNCLNSEGMPGRSNRTGNPYYPFLQGFKIIYRIYTIKDPNDFKMNKEARSALLHTEYPVSMDIEEKWSADPTSKSFADSMASFIKLIENFKAHNSISPTGYYSLLPYPWYRDHIFEPISKAFLPLANVVDYYSPSFYNYAGADTIAWRKRADALISAIHKYYPSKPIYPFVWPSNIDSDQVKTAQVWSYMLNYLYKNTNGAIFWAPKSTWNPNALWWVETKKFMTEKNLVPPVVIDSALVLHDHSSGNNILRWVTSVDTTTKFYQIERSIRGKEFKILSPEIQKKGDYYTINEYDYIDSNPPKHVSYRLKIVSKDSAGAVIYKKLELSSD